MPNLPNISSPREELDKNNGYASGYREVKTNQGMQTISQSDLTVLNGDASRLDGGVVRLTPAERTNARGSAFSSTTINLGWDFSASFTFQIKDNVKDGGDGLTFTVLGSNPVGQLGDNGMGLGYGSNLLKERRPGIGQSIAIEYDTYQNDEGRDPSNNHIGLNTNGDFGAASKNSFLPIFDSGKTIFSWINYYSASRRLDVFVNDKNDKNNAILGLRQTIDIAGTIGNAIGYVGFTAATGDAISSHDILSFQLQSFAPGATIPGTGTPVMDVPGSGGGDGSASSPADDMLTAYWKPKGSLKKSKKKPVTATILGNASQRDLRAIDVTSVYADDDTLRDGEGATVALSKKRRLIYSFKDMNKDGLIDLKLTFNARELQRIGATSVSDLNLFGRYSDGTPFASLSPMSTL